MSRLVLCLLLLGACDDDPAPVPDAAVTVTQDEPPPTGHFP